MSDDDAYDIPQEINETDDDEEDLGLFSEDVWAVEFLVMIRISKEELNLVQRNEKRQIRKARLKHSKKAKTESSTSGTKRSYGYNDSWIGGGTKKASEG